MNEYRLDVDGWKETCEDAMCTMMMLEWECDGGCAGNAWCAAVWLGNYNRNTQPIDFKDDEKIKEFIVAKVSS